MRSTMMAAGALLASTIFSSTLFATASARAQPETPAQHAAHADSQTETPPTKSGSAQFWLKDSATGCMAAPVDGVVADAISFSGTCDRGHASGHGTLVLTAHGNTLEVITGEFADGTLRDGRTAIRWSNGSAYDGNVVAGRMQGDGVLTNAGGDRFEGRFAQGALDGRGTAVWANGDRYDGEWHAGKASGRGVQVWADGRTYDGEWRNDQPNGHGIVTRKDGSRFEGEFADGAPAGAASTQSAASAPSSSPAAEPANTVVPDKTVTPSGNGAIANGITALAGKKFVALDGSSLALTADDDGVARTITAPNGSTRKNVFALLGDRVGSVSDGDDDDHVVGVFRLTDAGLVADYGDGRSESLFPNAQGGISMIVRGSGAAPSCMAWYPESHQFSLAERKAALADYASRLGLPADAARKGVKAQPVKEDCGDAAAPPSQHAADIATPLPKPPAHAGKAHAAHVQRASFEAPMPAGDIRPVEVRNSTVHLIDGDAPSAAQAKLQDAVPPKAADATASAAASASDCLSVASDGQHWAFRNHCGYDVQFSYCLMHASDPIASCDQGAVSGSVAAKGSSALVADRSLSETNVDHDFRWVACGGGAGEVVVHLDKSDPPAGRCVRRDAS